MGFRLHDVIVIGAGPAGNIAAFNLSTAGHRVLVLDSRRNIGDKLCTGIIGVECAERFPPDDEHVISEAKSATLVSPVGKRHRIVRDTTQALIIDRVAYVGTLARRAMEAGAEYELGPRVANVEVSNEGVSVLTAGDGGQGRYRADMVIIASGFGTPLLKMVGLQNGRHRDYMVGSQAEVEVDGVEDTEVYLGREIAPGSFGWLVPVSDSSALIGIVARGGLNGHMGRFISSLQGSGRVRDVIKEPSRWGVPLRPLSKTFRDRVLVVGDAAGLVKPTTGGGIYYALLSGEIAASTAGEALAAGDFSARRLKGYETKWRATFGRDLRIGYGARLLYEAMGDRQLERLLSAFASPDVQSDLIDSREFSFDWHGRVILKTLRHRDLRPLIESFGPIVARLLSWVPRAAVPR